MHISDAVKRIDEYLKNSFNLPFFVSVECGKDYAELCNALSGLHTVRISDYCSEDSYPDYDKLFDDLKHMNGSILLLGMGESVQFTDDSYPIQSLKEMTFSCKIVVPCRGAGSLLDEYCSEPKFAKLRCCFIHGAYDCSIVSVSNSFVFTDAVQGYRELLKILESGEPKDKIYVQTSLPINTAYSINSAYSAIKEHISPFNAPHNALSNKEWQEFLNDNNLEEYPLEHWRTYLLYLINSPSNVYLKAVIEHSSNYNEYQYNLLNYILEISPYAPNYWELYYSRKELFQFINKKYYDANIANYIMQSLEKRNDRIYYLTDSTIIERYEIIMAIVDAQIIPNELEKIYPDLAYYLNDYIFPNELSAELTSYFIQYKKKKLFNKLDDEFLSLVNDIASDGKRIFNLLRAKNSVIEKFDDGQTTLVWVDALGVEYLGYLQKVAQEMELSVSFYIGRSILPTITKYNSDFYYQSWKGEKEEKISDFDNRKHKDNNYRSLSRTDAPVYLADELMDLRSYLEKIRNLLQQGKKRVIIASDHGASRLVVLHTTKKKWEIMNDDQQTTLQKESRHGGRCCYATKSNVKPDCASVENTEDGKTFWVLANYDRFDIGKESGVEMHGGGTLEEVVVPIIEVTLSDTVNRPKIKCETPEVQFTDTQDPFIILFCPTPVNNLRLKIEGKIYSSERNEDNRYKIVLTGCEKRQRTIYAECLDGDDFLTSSTFEIKINRKNKGMKENKSFDDFFEW